MKVTGRGSSALASTRGVQRWAAGVILVLGAAATCRVRLGTGTHMLEGWEVLQSPSGGWGIKIRAEEGGCRGRGRRVAHCSLGVLVHLLNPWLRAVFWGSSLPGEAPGGSWHELVQSLPHGLHLCLPPRGAKSEQLSVSAPGTEASSHLEQKPRALWLCLTTA